jgi:NAD(P)-dependent dehydrogenase (short-subunit alcohol dehydrogenase family)
MRKKNVLITGVSRGIGKAIKDRLDATNQYNLIVPSRIEMDLTNSENIVNYFNKTDLHVDILINNAGTNVLNAIEDITMDTVEQMLSINLKAPLQLIKSCVPYMKSQQWGRIVSLSSIWGVRSKEFRTLYSAAKFGINGITKALSRELGEYGILVNAVCPGYVNTELTNKNVPPAEQEKIKATIPLRRFAEPGEIANLIKFLISDENTYITGQAIVIDGGFLA